MKITYWDEKVFEKPDCKSVDSGNKGRTRQMRGFIDMRFTFFFRGVYLSIYTYAFYLHIIVKNTERYSNVFARFQIVSKNKLIT